ncbi:hypothetical protein FHR83_009069 [Actinoplanes campanulatus]|uniref:Uncharacterized protein n=2 Tax=Actinoplanes campanulatus TaxID=113559 RepID=A0A7W5ARZ0_9ACTN|nr:hypothetical protein [Actinoplanes campanulatus]GGN48411.1 hypothetical protein GCM10010109_85530 [Actinoplanes campanulatus]GID41730.1 hypothetical protein Aca09nite_82360 [Actinoplanes campanulatus]
MRSTASSTPAAQPGPTAQRLSAAQSMSAALAGRAARVTPGSARDPLDRLRTRERIESIARLRAAARALGDVDVSGWDDDTLTDHLDDLSRVLCALDAELARVADAVRARGFRIAEEPKAA